jgi:uncharacterized membrane protein (UPF0182 family)
MANKNANKTNIIGIIIFFIVIIAITSFGSLLSFVTDYKWFQEIGYTNTFLTKIRTQFSIGVPIFIILYGILNYYMTFLKKKYYKELAIKNDNAAEKKVRLSIRLVSIIIAFFFSTAVSENIWFEVLKFFKGTSFNILDPIFNNDVGFYVFQLSFVIKSLNFLMVMLFIFMAITAVFNILLLAAKTTAKIHSGEKVIDFEGYGHRPKSINDIFDKKTVINTINQIALFGLAFMIALGVRFWLMTYDLLYSTRGEVFGASYTDIYITLNMYRILALISIAGAFTFYFGARKRNIIMALSLPAALIAISILGGIAGGIVQNLIVEPDEISKEMKYIEYNIDYTQKAYGLDNVKDIEYDVKYNLTAKDLENNRNIIENIRINDYRPINQVYNQIQGIRPYYVFNDVDIDRYTINGKYTQVFLSARELDQTRIDSQAQNWINQALKYTHGYGLALSPVNTVTTEGQPVLMIRDIPPITQTDLQITRPEIYFGEKTNNYVILNTDEEEFDYPSGSDNVMTLYEGEAGIKLTGFNRLIFALRERSLKILISNNINSESRIVINRNVIDRVNKIAPFLYFGEDPYLVINQEDGKMYWIVEGFSVTNKYPYSQPFGNTNNFNYIRNSVKVVIDAYNGTTDFYIVDEEDALAETYKNIFPDLFKTMEDMPQGIKTHLRYAQDYFDIQAEIYRTYHMSNPTVFFGKEDLWNISLEKYMDKVQTVESNFLMFKLPEEDNVEFLLSVPYSPVGKNNMTAMLVARNDGDNYGELIIYRFSKNENIPGTNMIESRIDQDSEISPQLTLWSQEGSNVLRGNLLIIPIEESLLYVEPIYLQANNENSLPEMKRVIVAYGDRIVMETTLQGALNKIFGTGFSSYDPGQDGVNLEDKTVKELINEANDLFQKSQEALKNGEWTRYGQLIEQLRLVLEKLDSLQ